MWYVYLLRSLKKDWYYVGSTNRISERVKEHNDGKVKSTKAYVPLILVYTKEFYLEKDAQEYEQKIKNKRTEKESIIKILKT